MKKLAITLFIGLTGYLQATAQTAPTTAQQVFDTYVTAIGGKDALMKVTDITTSMSADMGGNAMIMTRRQKLPNKFTMSGNMMGMEVYKQVSDGSKVMMSGRDGNNRTLDGPAAQQMIAANSIFPEMHYADYGVKSDLTGTEKVNGKDAYKVTNTLGESTWSDFYDAATGLKVQSIVTTKSPQGERTQTTGYSDYKAINGIKFPMTLAQQSPHGPMTLTVDDVKMNKGVKDSDFTIK